MFKLRAVALQIKQIRIRGLNKKKKKKKKKLDNLQIFADHLNFQIQTFKTKQFTIFGFQIKISKLTNVKRYDFDFEAFQIKK